MRYITIISIVISLLSCGGGTPSTKKNQPTKDISWVYGDWTNEDGFHFCVLKSDEGRVVIYDFSHGTQTKFNSGKIYDEFFDEFHIENYGGEYDIIFLVNNGIKMKDAPKLWVDYDNKCLRNFSTKEKLSRYTYSPFM